MGQKSVYTPLDQSRQEIRVLVVEPGTLDHILKCRFEIISLLAPFIPAYETASYVWGKHSELAVVVLNEQRCKVPRSAEAVLKRMRYETNPRTVWIDGLCIQQENLVDKNYLVSMMCEIYTKTACNFVWLGEDDFGALETFHALEALYEEARAASDNFTRFKEIVWPGWWSVYGSPTAVQYSPVAMAKLFMNPWFSRLWVVQEAALAPNSVCYCGSHTIPLLHLLRAAVWLYSRSKTLPEVMQPIIRQGLARAVHTASYADPVFKDPFQCDNNLLWMMHTLRQYDATVDKDHVYGLLGMYQRFNPQWGSLPKRILPDYERNVRDIFCDATKLAMVERHNADALLYVCHRSTSEVEGNWLPTWVMQWQRKEDVNVDHLPLNYKGFAANGPSLVGKDDVLAGPIDELRLQGLVVDEVVTTSSTLESQDLEDPASLLSFLQQAEDITESAPIPPEDLPFTLVASLTHARVPMSPEQSTLGYQALKKQLVQQSRCPETYRTLHLQPAASAANAYYEAIGRWAKNQRFFMTAHNHIGVGPRVAKEGDLVVVLQGCSVPMLLRPCDRREGDYYVVGPAYVHGIMFGEAWERRKAGREGLTLFTLV